MNRWDDLSLQEKNQLLGIYASKGYTDLASIISHYNTFQAGGPIKKESNYSVGRVLDGIYRAVNHEEFMGEPSHKYQFIKPEYVGLSEEKLDSLVGTADERGHRSDVVKAEAHPSHYSRGAWSGNDFELTDKGLAEVNHTYFGLNDGGQDPQARLTYKGSTVLPEITITPDGAYIYNTYDNIKLHLKQRGGSLGKITPYGQWEYPHQVTTIPSNNITMKGVDYPVIGVSNTGDTKYMLPNMDYLFDGQYVTEYPVNSYKMGGQMNTDGSKEDKNNKGHVTFGTYDEYGNIIPMYRLNQVNVGATQPYRTPEQEAQVTRERNMYFDAMRHFNYGNQDAEGLKETYAKYPELRSYLKRIGMSENDFMSAATGRDYETNSYERERTRQFNKDIQKAKTDRANTFMQAVQHQNPNDQKLAAIMTGILGGVTGTGILGGLTQVGQGVNALNTAKTVGKTALNFMGRPVSTLASAQGWTNILPAATAFDQSLMGTLGLAGVYDATSRGIKGEIPWYDAIGEGALSGLMTMDLYPALKGGTGLVNDAANAIKTGFNTTLKNVSSPRDVLFGSILKNTELGKSYNNFRTATENLRNLEKEISLLPKPQQIKASNFDINLYNTKEEVEAAYEELMKNYNFEYNQQMRNKLADFLRAATQGSWDFRKAKNSFMDAAPKIFKKSIYNYADKIDKSTPLYSQGRTIRGDIEQDFMDFKYNGIDKDALQLLRDKHFDIVYGMKPETLYHGTPHTTDYGKTEPITMFNSTGRSGSKLPAEWKDKGTYLTPTDNVNAYAPSLTYGSYKNPDYELGKYRLYNSDPNPAFYQERIANYGSELHDLSNYYRMQGYKTIHFPNVVDSPKYQVVSLDESLLKMADPITFDKTGWIKLSERDLPINNILHAQGGYLDNFLFPTLD